MCTFSVWCLNTTRASIVSIKLVVDLYWCATHEQAVLGAWVMLETNIARPQLAPATHPNPRAMRRSVLCLANVYWAGGAIIP